MVHHDMDSCFVVLVVGCSCIGRIPEYHCHDQHWVLDYCCFIISIDRSLFESEIEALPAHVVEAM
jgi:hypothetical protein